jgi:hypothetical protein
MAWSRLAVLKHSPSIDGTYFGTNVRASKALTECCTSCTSCNMCRMCHITAARKRQNLPHLRTHGLDPSQFEPRACTGSFVPVLEMLS